MPTFKDPAVYNLLENQAVAFDTRAVKLGDVVTALQVQMQNAQSQQKWLREQAVLIRQQLLPKLRSADAQAATPSPLMADDEDERDRSCTGKRSYRTLEGAGEAAKHINDKRDVDLRIYGCRFCGGFHFTSSSLERFAGVAA